MIQHLVNIFITALGSLALLTLVLSACSLVAVGFAGAVIMVRFVVEFFVSIFTHETRSKEETE